MKWPRSPEVVELISTLSESKQLFITAPLWSRKVQYNCVKKRKKEKRIHRPEACVKAYWHSLIHSSVQNNHRINWMHFHIQECKWWQLCSIWSLNVSSIEAHGQVKEQRLRQMDSLCGTRSRQICLEAERDVAPSKSRKNLNGSICAASWRSAGLYQTIRPKRPNALRAMRSRHSLQQAWFAYSVMQAVNDRGSLERLHFSPCALNSVIPLTKL